MRNYLKWLVNQNHGVFDHRGPKQHHAKPLFRAERGVAPAGNGPEAKALQARECKLLSLSPGHIFMILLDQSDVHVHILIGNQRHFLGYRRGLQGIVPQKLLLRLPKRLFAVKIIYSNFVINDSTSIISIAAKTFTMPWDTTTGMLVSSRDARRPKRMGISVIKNP